MKKILLSLGVTFCCVCAEGQVMLEGRILEKVGKEPVPYANIGIPRVNVGTISEKVRGIVTATVTVSTQESM